ncbi:Protein Tube [Harpegnathos saltator]|uniref:Protein Tube n=1 Tax=Harpegnathos saltator TaxID=610380 RepID=E2B9X3_HARSA|nr:Protein Tube [Harpegnathos saltator]
MEIRKLKPSEMYRLGIILNISDNWKKLMANVPKQENVPKFSSEHIEMIEQAAHKHNRNAAEIFLDEWSTMGRKRPTLRLLLDLLIKAELFRAADYVALERPKRPEYGPIASIDTSDATINKILEEQTFPKDTFDDSLALESSLKLEVNKMYLDDKTFDNLKETTNRNSSEITERDDTLNSKKSMNAVSEIVSDLMKFNMTDSCKAIKHEHEARTLVSVAEEQLPIPIIIGGPIGDLSNTKENCQEVTSQELPVFLNNSMQSTVPNVEMFSEHSPVSFNNPVQPTVSNEEVSSEYLPVFLNNSIQSTTLSNEQMSSSNIPLCLKR